MRAAPKVLDGARGPEHRAALLAAAEGEAQADVVTQTLESAEALSRPLARTADERVYHSVYAGYRLQVTSPADIFDPTSGKLTRARPKFAQFRQGEFRTRDVEIIKALDASASFGPGREFWDAEAQRADAAEKSVKSLAAQVAKSPKLRAQVLELLGAGDGAKFKMPKKDETVSSGAEA